MKKIKAKRMMSKKEIKRKKAKIKRTFFTIIAIIVLIFISLIINDYIILDKNEEINLIINNNNVTADLKNEILIEDNIIYLSKEDVKNLFDKYIYDEIESNQIITTYDKKIAAIGFEKNEITINGAKKQIYAHAIKNNDMEYLPVSEMKNVYNIEIEYIEESKIITIDFLEKEQKRAIISSDAAVKSSTGFISKTVERVKKGESAIIIASENGKTKIRTQNGKIGYIKSDKLENEYTVRDNMLEEKQVEGKVNLKIDSFSSNTKVPDRSKDNLQNVNVISPTFFYIEKNGSFKENMGNEGKAYIEWCHNQNCKIWPILSNIGEFSNSLNSYEKRQELIEKIVTACVKDGVNGININFENVNQENKEIYYRFIIELTPRLKEIGLVTSINISTMQIEDETLLEILNEIVDYVVCTSSDTNLIEKIDNNKVIIGETL